MKTNRRKALQSIALLPLAVTAAAGEGAEQPTATDPSAGFFGSWFTTKGTTSFVLSIEPQGGGLLLMIQNGGFHIERIKWKPMPGGVVVRGIPFLRLWAGRNSSEIRAEREDLPREATSEQTRLFPLAFFMSRATAREFPPSVDERPMRAGWNAATLPADWDERAGQWNK